jgi:major vault protein
MRSDQMNDASRGSRGGAKEGGRGGGKRLSQSQQQTLELQDNHFMHVKERPTGNIRCEIGPKMVSIGPNEMVQRAPQPLIEIPPDHFCVVRNPVRKNAFGSPLLGEKDKLKLRYGDKDVRLHSYGSFALFPGEQLVEPVQRMQQVPEGQALQLRALRAFLDKSPYLPNPMWRVSGDTWLFMGPAQYLPHAEAEVVGLVTPIVIQPNTALELKATNDFIDSKSGKLRNKGDVWLVRQTGPFLAGLDEEAVQVKTGHDVTITEALHVRAETNLTDAFGIQRSAQDEWLVTTRNKIVYIPEINETVVGVVQPTHVSSVQFCVLEETVREDEKLFRHRKVVQGDKKFFLQPNQRLVIKPCPKYGVKAGEALELKVMEPFMDEQLVQPRSPAYMSAHMAVVFALLAYLVTQPISEMFSGSSLVLAFGTLLLCLSLLIPRQGVQVLERHPGSTYLVYGPLADYVPSAQVECMGTKKAVVQVPTLGIFAWYLTGSG